MRERGAWTEAAGDRRDTPPGGDASALLPSLLAWMRKYLHGFYAVAGVLLSAGLLLALLGLWALAGLTEEVLEGETIRFDQGVLLWMESRATGWLDVAALRVTALGDGLVVFAIALVASTLLWLLKRRAYALLLTVAVCGAFVISPVLKAIFDRPRPRLFEWRVHYEGLSASYPSGHALMSTVLLVALAYVVHRLSQRPFISVAASLVAALAIVLIGLSRMYLGVHYPSDVLAGYTVGFAWTIFCALTVEALRRRRYTNLNRAGAGE